MGDDRPRPDLDRLTVAEAADALGVSQDAVRKRIASIRVLRSASGVQKATLNERIERQLRPRGRRG